MELLYADDLVLIAETKAEGEELERGRYGSECWKDNYWRR